MEKRTPKPSSSLPPKKGSFRPPGKPPEQPKNTGDLLAEATSQMKAGKYARASGVLKEILSKDPDHTEALKLSATLHLKLGSLMAAKGAFDALIRKAMDREDYWLTESLLREYLAVGPRYIPFIELLGQVLETRGDNMAAVVEYGKAVEILVEDQDPDLQTKGADLYQRIKRLGPSSPVATRFASVFEPAGADGVPSELERDEGESAGTADLSEKAGESTSGLKREEGAAAAFPWTPSEEPTTTPYMDGSEEDSDVEVAPTFLEPPEEQEPETSPSMDRLQEPKADDFTQIAPGSGSTGYTDSNEIRLVEEESFESKDQPSRVVPVRDEASLAQAAAEALAAVEKEADAETISLVPTDELVDSTHRIESDYDPLPLESSYSPFPDDESVSNPPSALEAAEQKTATVAPPWEPEEKASGGAPSFKLKGAKEPVQEATIPDPIDLTPPEETPSTPRFSYGKTSSLADPPDVQERSGGTPLPSFDIGVLFPEEESPQPESPATEKKSRSRSARRSKHSSQQEEGTSSIQGESPQLMSSRTLFPTALKIAALVRSVISTIWAVITFIAVSAGSLAGLALLTVGILCLIWIGVNEKPDSVFHNLTRSPTKELRNPRDNGYLVLSQLGIVSSQYPVLVGVGRNLKPRSSDVPAKTLRGFTEVSLALSTWFGELDPVGEFQKNRLAIRQWGAQYSALLTRYHQWGGLPVEDLGFGSFTGPNEHHILAIHRLYIAEGFAGNTGRGITRLEQDLEAWRGALAQSKTLRMKMMAVEAITDDLIIVSGLLAKPDLNLNLLPRFADMGRLLTQGERSLRWPMQNQLVLEVKEIKESVGGRTNPNHDVGRQALAYLPLPTQKILNGHAKYYEALAKHESLFKTQGGIPKGMPLRNPFVDSPPEALTDYIMNPIDNILITEPWVDWEEIFGRILETEARLRLATLQRGIRKSPAVRDLASQIGGSGQGFFDPFSGYPMLLDETKTRLYSIGKDRTDNSGDPDKDVVVPLILSTRK